MRRLADKAQYKMLLKNDQLIQQKKEKKCFKGFQEGVINFKPTYKYDPGTDNWDTRCVSTYVITLCFEVGRCFARNGKIKTVTFLKLV